MSDQWVIVLGRNYSSRLGMIRAAGMAGYKVAVIKTDKKKKTAGKKDPIDLSSRYVKKYFCIKEPDDEGLIKLLLNEFSGEETKPVLLPTDDYTASVIDENSDALSKHFLFPNVLYAKGGLVHFMDKAVQKKLAIAGGMNVASGWTAVYNGSRYEVPEDVIYPCFIKPNVSFKGDKHFMQKCCSKEELSAALEKVSARLTSDVLIEQYIDIKKEYAVLGCADGSKVIIPAVITTDSMYKGVTATGSIRPLSEYGDLGDRLKKIIGAIGFTGLFDIDLYESEDGTVYFNEINMRFGASGYAVTQMGVNLPEMFIDRVTKQEKTANEAAEIPESATFANEKVCYQKFISGRFDKKEFKRALAEASFRFIKCADDMGPYRAFKRKMVRDRIKKAAGRVLRR